MRRDAAAVPGRHQHAQDERDGGAVAWATRSDDGRLVERVVLERERRSRAGALRRSGRFGRDDGPAAGGSPKSDGSFGAGTRGVRPAIRSDAYDRASALNTARWQPMNAFRPL